MVTYLLVRSGPEAGRQFPLDPNRPMHIGRGDSCEVMLTDPVSSRFHAVIYYEDGNWQLRDTASRNGTLVNHQKTDHAMLLDQSVITVGSTDIVLIEPATVPENDSNTQTIILDRSMSCPDAIDESFSSLNALRDNVFVSQLVDLYGLSLQLFRTDGADDVMDLAIDLLCNRTLADVAGFSVDAGDGRLVGQRVSPPQAAASMRLDKQLAKRVLRDGEAIWVKESVGEESPSRLWSDAILVPLAYGDSVIGVLHLYRHHSQFASDHFELAVTAGRLLGAALSRAHQTGNLIAANKRSADRNAESNEIVGHSAPIKRLKEKIVRVGRASGSVLIRGESGVGKELVAHGVHRASPRAERPMLTVNCAAIPRDLVESQLFGHKKGSFTGADGDHTGWFQQAHAGTLFLDEVGELTLEAQAKLLRILEGHPFLPVGGTQQILVDVRVIAATNRDLAEFVRERRFREDLFYRLSVFELLVPPLRDREEDIDLLIQHFFDHFRVEHHRLNLGLSKAARERLLRYPWPGNVRQLRNVIDSAVVMADDPEILPSDLGLHDAGLGELDTLRIDQWERRLIHKALERTGGSVPEAAELLGISRATAYRKIAEYDINR
ncbi:MAG: sigma 54-interacting transcriptional regulator [Planctomycetaceae bacterium]